MVAVESTTEPVAAERESLWRSFPLTTYVTVGAVLLWFWVQLRPFISEAPDLWTSRAPAKYKDRVPQLKVVDGKILEEIGLDDGVTALTQLGLLTAA